MCQRLSSAPYSTRQFLAIPMKSTLLSSAHLQIREDPEAGREVMDPARIFQQSEQKQDWHSGSQFPAPTHLLTPHTGLPLWKQLANTLEEWWYLFLQGDTEWNKQ